MGYDDNLHALNQLTDNWDGYQGKRPTAAAVATARWLKAVPVASGGVQLELHAGEASVEIYINPDGRVRGASFEKSE